MVSIFKRSAPPDPATSLDTASFVEQLSKQLQSYTAAVDAPGQQAVVDATRQLFVQFEGSKSGPQSVDLHRPGASLKPAKLDSLARRLAQTPGYSAEATAAMMALVSPCLAGRLGLVSMLAHETRLAAEAHLLVQATLAQASLDAAALVASAKRDGAQEAATLVRAAGGEAAAIKGELQNVRAEIAELDSERAALFAECDAIEAKRAALFAECDAIEAKRAAYFAAIPSVGVGFEAGATIFHITKEALEKSSYLSWMASNAFSEKPDRSGAIKVSDITADELRAVIEFLEEDKISDLKSFGQERLFKVAQRFGNEAMEQYVKDPQDYRAKQARLARLEGVGGASAIPAGYVRIEAGEFTMGSPLTEVFRFDSEVQHVVEITKPFLLKQTPVTQAQWQELMGNNPSEFFARGPDAAQRPVDSVSWYDAVAYCNARSLRDGLSPYYVLHGERGTPGTADYFIERVEVVPGADGERLPTEAQSEYATRAGSGGATYAPLDEAAWHAGNADNTTHPVAQKAANAWGLHDTLGNVWEWAADRHGPLSNATARDPQGPYTGAYRVIRGGGFEGTAETVRAAGRCNAAPGRRAGNLGFRSARPAD